MLVEWEYIVLKIRLAPLNFIPFGPEINIFVSIFLPSLRSHASPSIPGSLSRLGIRKNTGVDAWNLCSRFGTNSMRRPAANNVDTISLGGVKNGELSQESRPLVSVRLVYCQLLMHMQRLGRALSDQEY